MSDVKLGELVDASAQRDAVHVAIAPVIAVERLKPGQHIGFITGSKDTVGSSSINLIGVVDPFLKEDVLQGRRFWMFLYPKTITSLRHDWSHPAFESQLAQSMTDKAFSEQWLRRYAERVNSNLEPEEAFKHLIDGLKTGKLYFHGSDLHSFGELDDADELREHAETYLGIKIDYNRFEFTCSC